MPLDKLRRDGRFGARRRELFRGFLSLKHPIPWHDTFSTVFQMINPKALDSAFGRILADVAAALQDGDVIAIDRKALRGARNKGESARTRMIVSAYAARLRLTLASATADHGTEMDPALEVLGLIDLKEKVVTADALHRNRHTVSVINAGGGDWCLALKANQDSLLLDARACFCRLDEDHPQASTEGSGHGRKEHREAVVVSAKGLAEHHEFPGLSAFGRIEVRTISASIIAKRALGMAGTAISALSWPPRLSSQALAPISTVQA